MISVLKSAGMQTGKIFAILFLVVALCPPAHAGVALRLYYNDIPGETVADLINDSSFPNRPTSAEPINQSLEKLTTSGDHFGSWTRGYLEAPQTGDYIFLLASDDQSELWLSSSYKT